ncbi:hypothetical protein C8J56DRAFT_915191 [Mycena floridula]|nr:hypothetical protein C8J56DRAFT_915191 [Mycena floridula]
MTPTHLPPFEVPPYQIEPLVAAILDDYGSTSIQVKCAQALGSELYVGCSNGELMRFALQADDPSKPEAYRVLSRQAVANSKPIDSIVLVPSISRALILSDNQIHFYTLPSLDVVPYETIRPIRHVVTFAVDQNHLKRPAPFGNHPIEPVDFCVIKRNSLVLFSLRERLTYAKNQKEIPLPQGGTVACRVGRILCLADPTHYNIVDLESAVMFPIIPISQAEAQEPGSPKIKPSITLVAEKEFLILSWTGTSTIGIFISTEGDPTRGTLEWPTHPLSVCFDYPYVTSLLPNHTIEIHSIETQAIIQVVPTPDSTEGLASSQVGYLVPSTERSSKMRMVSVPLLRRNTQVG